MSITKIDKEYVANTYARFPVEIVKGEGSFLYDTNGKEYIDMGSGIGVTAFGFNDKVWTTAVTEQLLKVQHTSNLYYTEPCAKLAEALCLKTGMKKVFFANSGAEANECLIKVARKYASDKKGSDYNVIVTLKNSFHGRTLTTLSATGQDKFHEHFQPLTPGFAYANANDIDSVKEIVNSHKVCGILIECVQGEGGVIALEKDFVQGIEQICKQKDILLLVDEVQAGNGRTGKLYAYMNYGISPDVVSTAKGLGGGLPIGAVLMNEKTEKVLSFGDHGSTFGGNPVCASGALSIINRLDEDFLNEVNEKSQFIFDKLSNAKGVLSVTGMGLMIGIKTERSAKEVISECIDEGVLCLSAKDKVRLLPALNIPMNVLEKAIEILLKVIAK